MILPSNPTLGQVVEPTGSVKVYRVCVGINPVRWAHSLYRPARFAPLRSAEHSNPQTGDLAIDPDDSHIHIYISGAWIDLSPPRVPLYYTDATEPVDLIPGDRWRRPQLDYEMTWTGQWWEQSA